MEYKNVIKISAWGTRGQAKNYEFIAKLDTSGCYVLNKKTTSPSQGNLTNRGTSKVLVSSLTEAANLLSTDEYLINLVASNGKRALREYKKVTIFDRPLI